MTLAAAAIAIVCFALAFERLDIMGVAKRAIVSGKAGSGAMLNPALSDSEKERAVRAASIAMLASFGAIVWRSALAAALSALPVLVLHVTGVVNLSAVNGILVSWGGLALAAGVLVAIHLLRVSE